MAEALLIDRRRLGTGWAEFWTLNAPATRNALTGEMVTALRAACERARADTPLRAIVLRGAGGHFCAGGSLGDFASAIGRPFDGNPADDPLVAVNRSYGALLQQLCALPQFVIAAVQGAAMGGGVGLMCCADFVLAAPDAVFATPEVTLGIVPAQIAPFVVRRLGDAKARDWLLSGARWTAPQALAAGLVNAVAGGLAPSSPWGEGRGEGPAASTEVPSHPHPNPLPRAGEGAKTASESGAGAASHGVDEALNTAVLHKLQQLLPVAPAAMAQTKHLLFDMATAQPLDAVLDAAALRFAQGLRGPEAPLGLKAFAQRQLPPWAATTESTA
ncbi:enoyl-CoA hydratase/isomerase family protein [Ottowia testudinis]|uniref:enoyl-CoA hydratase/isomerase family protein n=1 Tax=Ottowia testudinis TaxID=2816950 RepID=UPI001FB10637|nr:enoyl-CoA hydratase/isomerase family protein [Ottowia testudinis]